MLAHFSFVHAAPLSSSPPSVPSSSSSQSGAPAVAEGEPTVPEDEEGEKCACVHCNACVHTHSFICTADVSLSHIRPACFMGWVSDGQPTSTAALCHTPSLPVYIGPGQVPTPGGLSPPASTGGAAQTKSQAGVTGNACCLVGEGGEGNLTA